MSRRASINPTELELEILKIAWERGSVTVWQIRDELAASRNLAYNSVQTVMTIMARKGSLRRVKKGNAYVYYPKITKTGTHRRILKDIVKRVFGGSALSLVLNLLQSEELDQEEIERLKSMLEKPEEGK